MLSGRLQSPLWIRTAVSQRRRTTAVVAGVIGVQDPVGTVDERGGRTIEWDMYLTQKLARDMPSFDALNRHTGVRLTTADDELLHL